MSEEQLAVIKDLIARAEAEPLPLIALTDEEIAALDGEIAELGPVPMPWLADKDEASRTLACQVALRGLAARRLAVPLGTDGDGQQRVALHDDLRAVLVMRRSAHGAAVALRQPDGRMLVVYLGVSGALEEAISPGGVHGFTVVSLGAVAGRLAAFADPDDAAVDDAALDDAAAGSVRPGPSRVLRLADIAQGADLPGLAPGAAKARAVTMVTRLVFGSGAGEQRLTVYAKEAGVILACPADADGEEALRFAEVSRSVLRERMADLVDVNSLQALQSGQSLQEQR